MQSNKVEYITAAGLYCTTHDVKVTFCMLEFSSSKTIHNRFHINNDKGESDIGYDVIIVHNLMVHLGLTSDIKIQSLQWDYKNVHMKDPRSFLGQYDLTKR